MIRHEELECTTNDSNQSVINQEPCNNDAVISHCNDQISHNNDSIEIDHEELQDRNGNQICNKDQVWSEKVINETVDPSNALIHDNVTKRRNGDIISLLKDSDVDKSNTQSSAAPNVNVENLLMEIADDDNFLDAMDSNDTNYINNKSFAK